MAACLTIMLNAYSMERRTIEKRSRLVILIQVDRDLGLAVYESAPMKEVHFLSAIPYARRNA